MEFANRTVNEVTKKVYAKDLIDTKESRFGFTCSYPGCGVEVALCSYLSSNLKAPYFKLRYNNVSHSTSCSSVREDSQSDGDGTDTSKPAEYVSKLIFENYKNIGTAHSGHKEAMGLGRSYHNFTVRHIAPLIRWYVENPSSGKRKLEVPESHHSTYEAIFQKLHLSTEKYYAGVHIYFGSLYIKQPFQRKESEITLHVYQIESTEHIEVILDTRTWSKSEILMTSGWVDEALNESHEAYRNNERDVLPYIFFLGHAEMDGRSFRCDRHEAFYAMAAKKLRLPTRNFGLRKLERAANDALSIERMPQVGFENPEQVKSGLIGSYVISSGVVDKSLASESESVIENYNYKNNVGEKDSVRPSDDATIRARRPEQSSSPLKVTSAKENFRTRVSKFIQSLFG